MVRKKRGWRKRGQSPGYDSNLPFRPKPKLRAIKLGEKRAAEIKAELKAAAKVAKKKTLSLKPKPMKEVTSPGVKAPAKTPPKVPATGKLKSSPGGGPEAVESSN